MARKKSVILTPTEKKTAVNDTKNLIKATKTQLATLTAAQKTLDTVLAKTLKDLDKQAKAARDEHAKATKANQKAITGTKATLNDLEAELAKLNQPAAVPVERAEPSPIAA